VVTQQAFYLKTNNNDAIDSGDIRK